MDRGGNFGGRGRGKGGNGGGRGRGRGQGQGQGQGRGRGRGSADQPRGPPPPETVLAPQMRDLNISTQEPSRVPSIPRAEAPAAAEASCSTSMASAKESVEGFSSVQIPSSSVSFGSIKLESKLESGQRAKATLVPVNRPDGGGKRAIGPIRLYANHFLVKFNPGVKIFHYDFDIQRVSNGSAKKEKEKKPGKAEKETKVGRVSKEDTLEVKKKLLKENSAVFGNAKVVFDGKKKHIQYTAFA